MICFAFRYASGVAGLPESSLRVSSYHTSDHNGVTHVYLQQYANGFEIVNAVANLNIDKFGRVLSFGNSLFTKTSSGNANPLLLDYDQAGADAVREQANWMLENLQLGPAHAVLSFAKFLNLEINELKLKEVPVDQFAPGKGQVPSFAVSGAAFAEKEIPAKLKWIQVNDGRELRLVWDLEVEMRDNWYNAQVDTVTGDVLQLIDWISDATYHIFPLGTNDPESGERAMVKDPAHPIASPLGWHDQNKGRKHTVTIGNNVYVSNVVWAQPLSFIFLTLYSPNRHMKT